MSQSSAPSYTVAEAIDHIGFNFYQFQLMFLIALAFMADSMEILILSIISPDLHCEWHISGFQQATLTTVVFLGMIVSSSFWGKLGDIYGRRRVLVWALFFLGYFGLLSTLAPSFGWLLGLRFAVGFFIGSLPQIITLCAEFLPSSLRSKFVIGLTFAWSSGAFLEALLGYLVMNSLGWRYLILFSAVPTIIFIVLAPCILPESAYYLAASGKTKEAQQNLQQVAAYSKSQLPPGYLREDAQAENQSTTGSFFALFDDNGVSQHERKQESIHIGPRLTLSVFFIWFGSAFSYYGLVLVSTELLDSSTHHCSSQSPTSILQPVHGCYVSTCKGLSTQDYLNIVYTTLGEFPGTILALLLSDLIGRTKTVTLLSLMYSVSTTFLLVTCGWGRLPLLMSLFSARAFSTAVFQMSFLITIECYPTHLRAIAMGSGSGMARLGAMATPYVAQVMLLHSVSLAVIVYTVLGFVLFVVCLTFPVETKGLTLDEN